VKHFEITYWKQFSTQKIFKAISPYFLSIDFIKVKLLKLFCFKTFPFFPNMAFTLHERRQQTLQTNQEDR